MSGWQAPGGSARSPLDRQPPSTSLPGQPPSFKSNVNRAKTKKWVEAKSYSYDGDDWGEYDEYDEYGADNEPPPLPEPTSSRQPGQTIGSTAPGRSFTNPISASNIPPRRTNSFDAGDERRAFSSELPSSPLSRTRPPSLNTGNIATSPGGVTPIAKMPQYQQLYGQRLSEHQHVPAPLDMGTGPEPGSDQRNVSYDSQSQFGFSGMSNTQPIDFQQRRDFSPSALPPPLHTRVSPAPPSATSSPAGARFPPRKSSIGLQTSPTAQAPTPTSGPTQSTELPRAPSRDRASSDPGKPLPFIRPADIYKRMQEERERERRSSESEGPLMAAVAGPPAEDAGSPPSEPRQRTSSESLARSTGRRQSLEPVLESPEAVTKVDTSLEPVPERSNGYEFSGFTVNNPILARAIGANVASPTHAASSAPAEPSTVSDREVDHSTSPTLPEVATVATSFSNDFWASSEPALVAQDSLTPDTAALPGIANQPQHLADVSDSSAAPSSGLQHQPSIGFRSVVHQAFDRPDESSVPITPVSREGSQSQTGSSVSTSNTESTAGISPIMSRVPPAPTVEVRQRSTPAIAEESGHFSPQNARPFAPATSIVLNQIPRKPSPAHSRNASADSQPKSFTPGYRRDLDTPSPGNSPARSLAIEASNQTPLPETGEIEDSSSADLHQPELGLSAKTTHPSINYATREADFAHAVNSSPNKQVPGAAQAVQDSRDLYLDTHRHSPAPEVKPASRAVSPIPQAESPSKGRVRDLAGRFNEIDNSRRNSAISVSSANSWSSRNTSKESLSPTRGRMDGTVKGERSSTSDLNLPGFRSSLLEKPLPRPSTTDRGSSFRPKLPGEWVSYATTPGTATPAGTEEQSHLTRSQAETSVSPQRSPLRSRSISSEGSWDASLPTTPTATRKDASDDMDITPTTTKHPSGSKEAPTLDTNPLAALQAAGSAMADALMASMGMGKDEEPSESVDTDFQAPTRKADAPSKQPETWKQSVGDIYLRPLAVQRSMTASSAASSIPPTPPPKDIRSAESPGQTSNYFASSSPPKESRLAPPMQTKDLDEAQRPALLSQSSTDSSLPEAESDRLTNEIVRSLTPQPNAQSAETGNAAPPIQSSWSAVPVPQHNRESTIAPREHDSYRPGGRPSNEDTVRVSENPWVDEDCDEPSPSVAQPPADSAVKEEIHQPLPVAPDDPHRATKKIFDAQPALLNKRFSWEKNPASDLVSNATVAELASRDNMPYKERSAGLHVVNAELELEPETPDIESAHGDPSAVTDNKPAAQEQTLNSEPQIPGTPASASAGAATESQTPAAALPLNSSGASTESPHTLHATEKSSPYLSSPKQSLDSPLSPIPFRELSSTLQTSASPVLPSTVAPQSPISPSTRIPPFREILALKSTNERIQTYNKTREQFAGMNTGLSEWVAATLAAHPEHAEVLSQAQRPSVSVPGKIGSIKHRHSPSIMRFTKQGGSTQQGTPYYQQYLDSASAVPDAMSSSAAGMGQLAPGSPVGASNQGGLAGPSAGVGDRRITGQQMQAKGKDLLASAGKMGGKGMVGAKGLFAKGKKRFGSGVGGGDDKATESSSSSPSATSFFRRSNRSRPSSVVLPANNDVAFGPSDSTPPTLSRSRSEDLVFADTQTSVPPAGQELSQNAFLGYMEQDRRRNAPWNADRTDGLEDKRSVTPGRFGVLPSANLEVLPALGGETTVRGAIGALGADRKDKTVPGEGEHRSAQFGCREADERVRERGDRPIHSFSQEPPDVPTAEPLRIVLASKEQEAQVGALDDRLRSRMSTPDTWERVSNAPSDQDAEKDITPTQLRHALGSSRPDVTEATRQSSLSSSWAGEITTVAAGRVGEPTLPTDTASTRASHVSLQEPSPVPPAGASTTDLSSHPTVNANYDSPAKEPLRPISALNESLALPVDARMSPDISDEEIERPSEEAWQSGRPSGHQDSPTLAVNAQSAGERGANAQHVYQEQSANRYYQTSEAEQERPMSYMPLSRDTDGHLSQESLNRQPYSGEQALSRHTQQPFQRYQQEQPSSGAMAAARLAGMPASYQTGYQQQPHVHDSMQQTYGRQTPAYDTPPVLPPKDGIDIRTQRFTSPAIDPRQHNIEYQLPGVGPPQSTTPDPRAKRTSHFFGRNSLRNSNPAVLSTNDRINPQLVADDDVQRSFSISSRKPDSQAKRKSGLFRRAPSFGAESFLSRDSSNAGRPGSRTELKSQSGANPALPAAIRAAESTADRPGTLEKPQRASTSGGQLDTGKKKRFSTFGSLFGRSGTTGHSAEKPKKLTKSEPPKTQQPRQTSPGPSRNQSAYEAMRSHYPTVPRPQHGPRSTEDDIPSPQGQQEVQGSGTQGQVWQQPPIGGYYAPPGWTAQSTPPPQVPTENRRNPSGGRPRYVDAPSDMAPVSIQYGSPYQSQNSYDIGPQRMASPRSPRRSGPDSLYPQQRAQQSQPSPYDVYAPLPPQLRHYSANSVSTKISPQVSAQSPTQSPHHSSRGSVSPIDTFRHGSSSFRQQQPGPRMGSLGAQVARSPAQDHSGQQTPWAIALPTEDEDPRYIYSAQQQYSEPPPQGYQPRRPPYAPQVQPYRDPYQRDPSQYPLPMSPQSPTFPQYPSMPAMSPPPLPPKTPLDTRMYDVAHVKPSPYPSPPYSPSADQQYAPQAQSQYRSQPRYYQQERPNLGSPTPRAPTNRNSNNVNPNMFHAPSQPQTNASNDSHDTSWGTSHTGESDERIEMRGASYPGQEWAPSGLSHQSWD